MLGENKGLCGSGSGYDKGTKSYCFKDTFGFCQEAFEEEVTEIKDGIVEVKSISREPGTRTKNGSVFK